MASTDSTTRYAIARGLDPIDASTYVTVADAQEALASAVQIEKSIGLEPDVQIVTIEYTTTIGDPVAYVEDVAPVEPAAPVDETPAPDASTIVDTTPPVDSSATTTDDGSTPDV